MSLRKLSIVFAIVLIVAGVPATVAFVRVHSSLAGLTTGSHTVWDTLETILPWTRGVDRLRPGPGDFAFEPVSDADLDDVREIADDGSVAGLGEFIELPMSGRSQGVQGEARVTDEPAGGSDGRAGASGTTSTLVQEVDGAWDDESRINILLLGIQGERIRNGGLLADAILVASLDTDTMQGALISIPRDLYVEVPEVGGHYKINAVHAIGETRFGRGLEFSMKTVSEIAGIPMHYAVRFDTVAFERLIDHLGGLDVQVQQSFVGMEDEEIAVSPGVTHMDGKTALSYARSRRTTDDFDRSRRQREVLEAIKDRLYQLGNPLVLLDALEIVSHRVATTMSTQDIRALLAAFSDRSIGEIEEFGFDASSSGMLRAMRSQHGEYILVPRAGDYSEMRAAFRRALP